MRLVDFGPVGTNDDTFAWTKAFEAINLAGGGRLELPPRATAFTPLTIPQNLTLVGCGKDVSTVSGSLSKVYPDHNNVNRLNLVVQNLGFTGSINLERADYFDFEHVSFKNSACAVRLAGAWRGGFRFCHFENIDNFGVLMEMADGVGCNHTWVEHSEIIGNNKPNFIGLVLRGQNICVEKNDISGSGNGLHGILIEGTNGLRLEKNYIEQWVGSAITGASGQANTRVRVVGGNIHAIHQFICDFDNPLNDDIRVDDVRFSDAVAWQTCIKYGAATNYGGSRIDTAAAAKSDRAF
jgi:hypothetical protein